MTWVLLEMRQDILVVYHSFQITELPAHVVANFFSSWVIVCPAVWIDFGLALITWEGVKIIFIVTGIAEESWIFDKTSILESMLTLKFFFQSPIFLVILIFWVVFFSSCSAIKLRDGDGLYLGSYPHPPQSASWELYPHFPGPCCLFPVSDHQLQFDEWPSYRIGQLMEMALRLPSLWQVGLNASWVSEKPAQTFLLFHSCSNLTSCLFR